MPRRPLTASQAAAALSVSESRIRQLASDGRIVRLERDAYDPESVAAFTRKPGGRPPRKRSSKREQVLRIARDLRSLALSLPIEDVK